MKTITKKVLPKYFQAIVEGKKHYELRLNDFDISEGDTLRLEEYDEQRNPTGRFLEKSVSYVAKFKIQELFWPQEEIMEKGIQIISFLWKNIF